MHEGHLLLALLLAGHLCADFLFQTGRMVRGKRRSARWLGLHGLEVALVHALFLLPCFAPLASLAWALVLAALHAALDAAKLRVERRIARPLAVFFADQALHLAVLAGVWWAWRASAAPAPTALALELGLPNLTRGALAIGIWAFQWNGVSAIVAGLLAGLAGDGRPTDRGPADEACAGREGGAPESSLPSAGRVIGILERQLVLLLAWAGQWGAIGLVLTAKSVARFKALDDRRFGEVYLIGTMTSVLLALVGGLLLRLLDLRAPL